MIRIIIQEKDGGRREVEYDQNEILIGRVPTNDLSLPRNNVSKQHAKLVKNGNDWQVIDLQSTNGTFVNTEQIQVHTLTSTDKVIIGDFLLEFEFIQPMINIPRKPTIAPPPLGMQGQRTPQPFPASPMGMQGQFTPQPFTAPPHPMNTRTPQMPPMAPPLMAGRPPAPLMTPPPTMNPNFPRQPEHTGSGGLPPSPISQRNLQAVSGAPQPFTPLKPMETQRQAGFGSVPAPQPIQEEELILQEEENQSPPTTRLEGMEESSVDIEQDIDVAFSAMSKDNHLASSGGVNENLDATSLEGNENDSYATSEGLPADALHMQTSENSYRKEEPPQPVFEEQPAKNAVEEFEQSESIEIHVSSETELDASQASLELEKHSSLPKMTAAPSLEEPPVFQEKKDASNVDIIAPSVPLVSGIPTEEKAEMVEEIEESEDFSENNEIDVLDVSSENEELEESEVWGELSAFLQDESVQSIFLQYPFDVSLEKNGEIISSGFSFDDSEQFHRYVTRLIGFYGLEMEEAEGIVEMYLPDGMRIHGVFPPIARNGFTLTIQPPRPVLSLDEMQEKACFSNEQKEQIASAISEQQHIFLVDGWEKDRSYWLQNIALELPETSRVVSLEEVGTLQLPHPQWMGLEVLPPSFDDEGLNIADLVEHALRLKPDVLLVDSLDVFSFLEVAPYLGKQVKQLIATVHASETDSLVSSAPIDSLWIFIERSATGQTQLASLAVLKENEEGEPFLSEAE